MAPEFHLLVRLIRQAKSLDLGRSRRLGPWGEALAHSLVGSGYALMVFSLWKGDVPLGHRHYLRFNGMLLVIDESGGGDFSYRRGDDHTFTLAALL
jgi:hypothetical protein